MGTGNGGFVLKSPSFVCGPACSLFPVPVFTLTSTSTRGHHLRPLDLAVIVLSSAPPADRGVIENGAAAAETGVRLVRAAPGAGVVYRAPALAQGERLEYVAIHYATRDGKRGGFLTTFAVRVKAGA